jgi:hypothetical protein
MTDFIVQRFQDQIKYRKVMNFVIGGLLFQEGVRGNNPLNSGINVEDLFSAVQLLAERNTIEAAPFISSWNSKLDEFDKESPYSLNLDDLIAEIYKSVRSEIVDALASNPTSTELNDIDRSFENACKKILNSCKNKTSLSFSSSDKISPHISKYLTHVAKNWSSELKKGKPRSSHRMGSAFKDAVKKSQPRQGKGRTFSEVNELMIRMLKEFVWIDSPERVAYLHPLMDLTIQRKRQVIASLNYDNSIELAAASRDITCNTCIEEWSKKGSFDINQAGLHLLKLHGSIDWKWEQNPQAEELLLPHSIISKVDPVKLNEDEFRPAVIFGHRNKLTAEGPFLDLLRAFQQELSKSKLLTVIGYSFGDDHINTYISHWLNFNQENCIRIIDPKFSKSQAPYILSLRRLQEKRSTQVEIIQKNASDALVQLYGKGDHNSV